MDDQVLESDTMDPMVPKIGLGKWDFVAVALYFVVIFGVGVMAMCRPSRNTVSGFFLAGRHMWWLPVS